MNMSTTLKSEHPPVASEAPKNIGTCTLPSKLRCNSTMGGEGGDEERKRAHSNGLRLLFHCPFYPPPAPSSSFLLVVQDHENR